MKNLWNKIVYKFDKFIYVLFYYRWNERFADNRKLRDEFLTSFRLWDEQQEPSDIAMEYAVKYYRSSSAKTNENLAKLIEAAIFESKDEN